MVRGKDFFSKIVETVRNFTHLQRELIKAAKQKLRILEIPVDYRCRIAGTSKVSGNLRASAKAATRILKVLLPLNPLKHPQIKIPLILPLSLLSPFSRCLYPDSSASIHVRPYTFGVVSGEPT